MTLLLCKLNRVTVVAILLAMAGFIQIASAMVVPHPLYKNPPHLKPSRPSEQFRPGSFDKSKSLPQKILVLRVQFTDVTFQSGAVYPDSLVHDKAFFERWMLHLLDFFATASRNEYIFEYDVPDQVYTLPNTMAYYGADTSTLSDARVPQMLQELIQMADNDVNYNEYDAIIVFHAGPGQESDVGLSPNFNSLRPNTIWSTFISRPDLQEAFDPENDNYPGISTNDGKYIKEIVLMPESEFHDYFPGPDDEMGPYYLFSIYGVLCHQFGHQIGLPTLFDNYSANGRSQGVGNWSLMGTGVWNNNGYNPAQLDAWCRYYLGWEQVQTITTDTENLVADNFLSPNNLGQRIYKIPISEKEYFLVENRQQNPDNSWETIYDSVDPNLSVTWPSFTFVLREDDVQDYYPAPNAHIPRFNFMENRYRGCEWDFYLPGLGGPLRPIDSMPIDGSGLIIWHIDENIIDANFDEEFLRNRVNGDASHKGVDVEEADGIQHLDIDDLDYYKYGGPFDAFRSDSNPEGNNPYFGNTTFDGNLHLPTAESYYGGIPLEVYDISQSGLTMSFSVRFNWKLDTEYVGVNSLDACSVDIDNNGKNEILYPMPDGSIYVWKDEELMPTYPLNTNDTIHSYVWDGISFYLACDASPNPSLPIIRLRMLNNGLLVTASMQTDKRWAASIMSFDDKLVLPFYTMQDSTITGTEIQLFRKNGQQIINNWSTSDSLVTNLAYFKQKIYFITKNFIHNQYRLNVITTSQQEFESYALPVDKDSLIVAMSIGSINPGSPGDIVFQTPYAVYLTDLSGNLHSGFPVNLPFASLTQASLSDIDKNGTLDILISGENNFSVYDYAGKSMLPAYSGFPQADNLGIMSGILAGDLDNDGKIELIGAFSRNRMAVFEQNRKFMSGFPVSYSDRSRNMPFIHKASDNKVYAWLPTDNGRIFRKELQVNDDNCLDSQWYCKYANLQRTSSREDSGLPNQFTTNDLFVPAETFLYPNPLRQIYEQKITFQIMTSRNAKVEVSLFDIAGNLIYRKNVFCLAYLKNRELVDLQASILTSGVYFAVLKSGNHTKRIKFAVEK